jgi:hypothetical protein
LLSFKNILHFLLEPQYTRKFEISSGPQININESKITLYMKTSLVTLFCYRVSGTTMHFGCALIVRKLWLCSFTPKLCGRFCSGVLAGGTGRHGPPGWQFLGGSKMKRGRRSRAEF